MTADTFSHETAAAGAASGPGTEADPHASSEGSPADGEGAADERQLLAGVLAGLLALPRRAMAAASGAPETSTPSPASAASSKTGAEEVAAAAGDPEPGADHGPLPADPGAEADGASPVAATPVTTPGSWAGPLSSGAAPAPVGAGHLAAVTVEGAAVTGTGGTGTDAAPAPDGPSLAGAFAAPALPAGSSAMPGPSAAEAAAPASAVDAAAPSEVPGAAPVSAGLEPANALPAAPASDSPPTSPSTEAAGAVDPSPARPGTGGGVGTVLPDGQAGVAGVIEFAAVSETVAREDSAQPSLSVSGVTVTEGTPGTAAAAGWFSTEGNQIVDAAGNPVQLTGVNWFGFEADTMAPHGLWARSYTDMLDQMAELGFNTLRLPFSSDMLHATGTASGIDYSLNPDLAGLTPIEVMDRIIDYAGSIGLRVILDHHRSDAGIGTSANGLWYDDAHSEAQWISDWQMLAERYADTPAVIGADLHNEPYNGTWGDGGVTDWARAATEAGNAIGAVNQNWLIFVEGIGTYEGESYWWGGNLMGVRDHPVTLDVDNKLVYSVHDYPNSVHAQPWFEGDDFAADLPAKFDQMWGYIYQEGIAPVWIGEFGTNLTDPKDIAWLDVLTAYLGGDFDNDGTSDLAGDDTGPSWTFWSWNPNSGDTGGILADDWTTVNTAKLAYLDPILFDFGETTVETYALFTISLSAAATETVSVDFRTVSGTADETDFVLKAGTLIFDPGETEKTIAVAVTPDTLAEGDETFTLVLENAAGATISRAEGTAIIRNDDTGGDDGGDDDGGEDDGGGTDDGGSGDGGTDDGGGSDDGGTDDGGGDTGGGTDPSGDGLVLSYALLDGWGTGFRAEVTVSNTGDSAVTGWELGLDMPFEIDSLWNAELVSEDEEGYVIRNLAWNGAIAASGSVSFGFTGTGSGAPGEVDLFLL